MSLRPCIAKLSLSLWATRRHVRASVFLGRRIEQRRISTRVFPAELQDTISPGVVKHLAGFHKELKAALEKKNADELCYNLTSSRRIFFTLPKTAWQYVRDSYLHLTRADLERIAAILAGRCKKGDAEALGQLLRDAKAMYGVEPSPELLLSALNALVRTGQQTDAYELLQLYYGYKKKPFRPNSQHWRVAMRGLAQIGDVGSLKECLSIMKSSWPFPGNPHYHALLEGLGRRADAPSIDEVREILDEMQKFRFPYDEGIHRVLVKLAEKHGLVTLPSDYNVRCDTQREPTGQEIEEGLTELVVYRRRARAAFETKLSRLRHNGFIPDERFLMKLVQMTGLSSSEELSYLHETLELIPNVVIWTMCMRNALEKNGWRAALATYNVAKSQGIRPDAAMVHPLLRAMCSRYIQEPPEPVLNQALDLYNDLNEHVKSSSKPGADTAVFNTLLRALAASSNKQKFFPVALRLLEDMRSQNVYMDRMTTTSVAVLLVRSSSTYEEAAEAYKHVHSVNADGLDEKGFAAVLHAFCSFEPECVSPETSEIGAVGDNNGRTDRPFPIPPAKLYFKIVQDMHAHGLRKTAELYTILLGRYAALATRARNVRDPSRRGFIVRQLRKVIKDSHHQISLDAGLQPDAPLLNQLMDAYNRAGLFRDAIQVWTMLNSTGLVSPASVSIAFDACGHHKESERADEIFRDLKERGFQLNRRNWHSWVECLCRLGRLDEALKVVCSDMAHAEDAAQRPEAETIKILLSFASAYDRLNEVRTHLETHIPDLWNSLHLDIVNR